MLADHSKNSSKQPSRNSRTNLSHTLGRRREATARQSNIVHNGYITTNLTGPAGKQTKRDGGKERAVNEFGENYVSRPQQKLKQTT